MLQNKAKIKVLTGHQESAAGMTWSRAAKVVPSKSCLGLQFPSTTWPGRKGVVMEGTTLATLGLWNNSLAFKEPFHLVSFFKTQSSTACIIATCDLKVHSQQEKPEEEKLLTFKVVDYVLYAELCELWHYS